MNNNTDKTRATQVEKYGGEAGYRAEMKRRRGLVKRVVGGFGVPGQASEAAKRRWEGYRASQKTNSKQTKEKGR